MYAQSILAILPFLASINAISLTSRQSEDKQQVKFHPKSDSNLCLTVIGATIDEGSQVHLGKDGSTDGTGLTLEKCKIKDKDTDYPRRHLWELNSENLHISNHIYSSYGDDVNGVSDGKKEATKCLDVKSDSQPMASGPFGIDKQLHLWECTENNDNQAWFWTKAFQ
ncbi:uncharacterized protein L201_003947 [Kwoniella dendrophila CBS 6074]|uniref:Ricin B lectin domain-containing protein n=1 Tax=Kwoniella dendrophila CBS 6074 TaxID=1295534 RepID=A0AAX4JVU2_9TREE